jgi:hypothetical protein
MAKFKKGNIPWNKGLMKETDSRVAETSKKLSLMFQSNYIGAFIGCRKGCEPWNKGLTKETDSRIAEYGEKCVGMQRSKTTKDLQRD